jgi:hypothetical protein
MTPTEPIAFAQASPTEIRCVGASGLIFTLPVVPICGRPGGPVEPETRRPA